MNDADARLESLMRSELNAKDEHGNSPAWKPNQYHASDIAFLFRLLDSARAATTQRQTERNEAYAKLHAAEEEIVRLHQAAELAAAGMAEMNTALAEARAQIAHLEKINEGERDARFKCEDALRKKDVAMGVLWERLTAAHVDCSDLIS